MMSSLDSIAEDEDHVMPAPPQPISSVNAYCKFLISTVAYIR